MKLKNLLSMKLVFSKPSYLQCILEEFFKWKFSLEVQLLVDWTSKCPDLGVTLVGVVGPPGWWPFDMGNVLHRMKGILQEFLKLVNQNVWIMVFFIFFQVVDVESCNGRSCKLSSWGYVCWNSWGLCTLSDQRSENTCSSMSVHKWVTSMEW